MLVQYLTVLGIEPEVKQKVDLKLASIDIDKDISIVRDLMLYFELQDVSYAIIIGESTYTKAKSAETKSLIAAKLSYLYINDKKYSEAIDFIETHISTINDLNSNEQVSSYINLAVAYQRINKYEQALSLYSKIINNGDLKEKDKVLCLNNRASIYSQIGEFEEAIEDLGEALILAKNPEDGEVDARQLASIYNNIGAVYQKLGNSSQAAGYFAKSTDLLAGDYESELGLTSLNNEAVSLLAQNKADQAIAHLESFIPKVRDDSPKKSLLLITLGEAYLEMGEEDKSIAQFKTAINTASDIPTEYSAYAILSMGRAYAAKGDNNKAVELFSDVEEMISQEPYDYIQLALYRNFKQAYSSLGNSASSLFYADKYMDLAEARFDLDRNYQVSSTLDSYLKIEEQKELDALNNTITHQDREISAYWVWAIIATSGGAGILLLLGFVWKRSNNGSRGHNSATIRAGIYDADIASLAESNTLLRIDNQKLSENVAQLKNEVEKERELGNIKTHYISVLSHEYRRPLTHIQMSSDILEVSLEDAVQNKQKFYFSTITKSVREMVNLLDQATKTAREKLTSIPFEPVRLEVVNYVRSLIAQSEYLKEYDVSINLETDQDKLYIDYDEVAFGQIASNLICNAMKYSPEGGKVDVRLSQRDTEIEIKISDQGIGIPQDELDKLFKPFVRSSNVGAVEGTGLGMYIVKRAVEAGNGTIEVDTEEGKGTTFTVILPISLSADNSNEKISDNLDNSDEVLTESSIATMLKC